MGHTQPPDGVSMSAAKTVLSPSRILSSAALRIISSTRVSKENFGRG